MIDPVRHGGKLTGFDVSAAHQPLTWRQVAAILVGLTGFLFYVMAYTDDIPDSVRHVGKIGLGISIPVCALLVIWHLRLVSRSDVFPDVLAGLVSSSAIYQLGRSHLTFSCRAVGSVVEIEGLVQNLTDADGVLNLWFQPPRFVLNPSAVIEPLAANVPASAVISVIGRFPSTAATSETHTFYLEGRFRSRGKLVRFTRRRALAKRTNPIVTLLALLGGHLHVGGGVKLSTTTDASTIPVGEVQQTGSWITKVVWSPEDHKRNDAK